MEWRNCFNRKDMRVSSEGGVQRLIDGVWTDMHQSRLKTGYLMVTLGKERLYVHRLVLEAFVGPSLPGMHGCHNNGKPSDNRIENLRWDTRAGNFADKWKHGTMPKPGWMKRIPAEWRQTIRDVHAGGGITQVEIAKFWGVTPGRINQIIREVK